MTVPFKMVQFTAVFEVYDEDIARSTSSEDQILRELVDHVQREAFKAGGTPQAVAVRSVRDDVSMSTLVHVRVEI